MTERINLEKINNFIPEIKCKSQDIIQRPVSKNFEIVISCGPLKTRPNQVLESILKSLNVDLTLNDFKHSACFGDWSFELFEDKEKIYEQIQDAIGEKLTELYKAGIIRSAIW
jgi:hypothetical protein